MSELNKLIKERGVVKGALTRFKTFLNKFEGDEEKNVSELKIRLQKIEESWLSFNEIQSRIDDLSEDVQAQTKEREEFENNYFRLTGRGTQLLEEVDGSVASSSKSVSNANFHKPPVKLPTITLPTFNGAYEEWTSFQDAFQSLIIDHPTLSEIQKFQHLKSALKSTAFKEIASLQLTSANFSVAWRLLQDRFHNKKIIIERHIQGLFNLSKVGGESASALRSLIDTVHMHLRALQSLNQPVDQWDTMIIYIMTSKLDRTSFLKWEEFSASKEVPTLAEFTEFINKRYKSLEALEVRSSGLPNASHSKEKVSSEKSIKGNKTGKFQRQLATSFVIKEETCCFCQGKHALFFCKGFKNISVKDRIEVTKTNNLCFNCLKSSHRADSCSSGACRVCGKKHNTLLHIELRDPAVNNTASNFENKPQSTVLASISNSQENPHIHEEVVNVGCSHAFTSSAKQMVLSTALINTKDTKGAMVKCRVLLDCGSQANFITKNFAQKLGLPQRRVKVAVNGISLVPSNITHSVDVEIKSRVNNYHHTLKCLILPSIAGQLPNHKIDLSSLAIPAGIVLADPYFGEPSDIDMLIGVEQFWNLLCIGQIKLGESLPYLQKTSLGWIVAGPMAVSTHIEQQSSTCLLSINNVDDQLKKFWELEEVSSLATPSKEERNCEQHFKETHERTLEGRFKVRLPLKNNVNELGDSFQQAFTRFKKLERRFQKNDELKESYSSFMREYLESHHMELVPADEMHPNHPVFYMPHQAVIREDSTTTKLRVVFDASAKSSTGLSLNETMMVGPVIQQELFSIILRFRTHAYVITADIAKMYRQIAMDHTDTDLQRILWRESKDDPISVYRLTTVTYGTSSAPFLATRCLKQLTVDEQDLKAAVNVAATDFYMDDLLTGADTIEEVAHIQSEVMEMCNRGCFPLRKWCSNEPSILKHLPEELKETIHEFNPDSTIKTLGLFWNPIADTFEYKIKPRDEKVTKRSVLSAISRIFDPLGLIGPVISRYKIFLQQLWELRIGWDESLPSALDSQWHKLASELPLLGKIQIPRLIVPYKVDIQLHGFSDASEAAYAACIYLVCEDNFGVRTSHLLCSKSRVAPLKKISLPRLELCGALLLSRLLAKVRKSITLQFSRKVLWSDSTIVLAWITSPSSCWKVFVSNRVSEIQELTEEFEWKHVPTSDNPADLPSRGIQPSKLENNSLWWHGSSWLKEHEFQWPQQSTYYAEIPEQKAATAVVVQNSFIEDFSSLQKLIRITAYMLRFINNIRSASSERYKGVLSVGEVHNALMTLIKIVQSREFKDDIEHLRKSENPNTSVSSNSKLLSLNPYLDDRGILRVGGRITNSQESIGQRHPILLPTKNHLTKLIALDEHLSNHHAGPQALLSSLRTRYWPLRGRILARNIVKQCLFCYKSKPKFLQQQMGNLPIERVVPSRPFLHTGVDFGGPIMTKSSNKRNCSLIKSYIAVFVCFATKAIHIELVSNLTTDAFLAALRRFIARRGKCLSISSDNATNFVGANRELREFRDFYFSQLQQDTVVNYLNENGINWRFAPPRSPHFGGLWEAAIKSVKLHLRRCIGTNNLSFEELYTLLTQIEAIVNSRPITPMSDDPCDLSPLTPGHFLIGDALNSFPEPNLSNENINRLSRWQRVQHTLQAFWKRWSREYLQSLQLRKKWRKPEDNIKVGDLVLVSDENSRPYQWPLGRVTELHMGEDGLCRVVTLHTARGSVKRAIHKLCKLPIEPDSNQ